MKLVTPLSAQVIKGLKAGDEVTLSGVVYTARDQAHVRLTEAMRKGLDLPLDVRGQVIYYCGPTLTPPGAIIGSCGPTTAARMDEFTPALLHHGLKAVIGKGARSLEVIAALKKTGSVYFLTYAGCGALLNRYVRSAAVVAYKELGPEAIFRLEVKDFPLIVGIDVTGTSLY